MQTNPLHPEYVSPESEAYRRMKREDQAINIKAVVFAIWVLVIVYGLVTN